MAQFELGSLYPEVAQALGYPSAGEVGSVAYGAALAGNSVDGTSTGTPWWVSAVILVVVAVLLFGHADVARIFEV